MSDNKPIGGAGPALAAHSKDGAAQGTNPASAATAPAHSATIGDEVHEVCESARSVVRAQPLLAVTVVATIGFLMGSLAAGVRR